MWRDQISGCNSSRLLAHTVLRFIDNIQLCIGGICLVCTCFYANFIQHSRVDPARFYGVSRGCACIIH